MRKEPVRHRGLLRRVGVTAVASLVAVALLVTPSSSTPDDPAAAADDTAGVPDGFPTENPGLAPYVASMTQKVAARRSKMVITVGSDAPMFSALYTPLWNTPVENPTSYKVVRDIPHPFGQPACATSDPATQVLVTFFRAAIYPFALTADNKVVPGVVARVPVRMVSFGAIPATATLTIRVPRINDRFQPLTAFVWGGGLNVNPGCDPSFKPRGATVVQGEVQISLSDLMVDGVPVELGPSCRTSEPVELRLRNEGNYAPGTGGTLAAFDGLGPASVAPLNSPYYYEDQGTMIPATTGITIPSFVGCGGGGDDLSPLVTALASGPNNPLRVVQKKPTLHNDQVMPWGDMMKCTSDTVGNVSCPLPAPPEPEDPPLPAEDQ